MGDQPDTTSGEIGVYPEQSSYTVAETGHVEFRVDLVNLTMSGDFFKIELLNIPFALVKYLPSQFIFLEHGEKKQAALFLTLPLGSVGTFHVRILVTRKSDQVQVGEAFIELNVTEAGTVTQTAPVLETQKVSPAATTPAYQERGRVGVALSDVRFHVAPGESITIPVQLTNQSLEDERLTLVVQSNEIPHTWISYQPAFIELRPGKTQTINLKISPPRKHTTRAGRYPFVLEVRSARFTDTPASVDCVLTVNAFHQSTIQVSPLQVFSAQPIHVKVENSGNTAETFMVAWEGLDSDLLEFEVLPPPPVLNTPGAPTQAMDATRLHQSTTPGGVGLLRVEPGKTGVLSFKADPISAPILRARRYDFQTRVTARDEQTRLFSCSLTAQPLVPVWAVALFIIVCLASFCTVVFLANRAGNQEGDLTSAENTQTAVSLELTVVANQTATAIGVLDSDGDGLTDITEIGLGINPAMIDTDLDGLTDGDEVNNRKTDPRKADSDGDGLVDGDEVTREINPLSADTDGDGLNDGDEVRLGTDPKSVDTDQDGWIDHAEVSTCHSPTDPDSDDDGIKDGEDLNPCDKNNPLLTQTGQALIPTATMTATPTQTTTVPEKPTQTNTSVPPTPTPTLVPPTFTSTVVPLTATPTTTSTPEAPDLAGNILFSSNREGRPQIYVQDLESGRVARLSVSEGDDSHPARSPDGRRIVFTSNRDGNHEIYIMDSNGANPQNLTNHPAEDYYPTWSPDGEWIAFSSNRDGNFEIYILRVDGSELQNVSQHEANDTQPFWGQTSGIFGGEEVILFVTDRDGNREIYSMRPDGSSPNNLTNHEAQDYLPELSPNGRRVAFTSEREGDPDILVMDTDGSDVVNLTSDSPAVDEYPTWSGDNAWIAYASTAAGRFDLFVTSADGSLRYNITMLQADDRDPAWR